MNELAAAYGRVPREATVGLSMTLSLVVSSGDEESFECTADRKPCGDTHVTYTPVVASALDDASRLLIRNAIEIVEHAQTLAANSSASSASRASIDLGELSARERTVLELLSRGNRADEIASALGISIHTARNHRKSIYAKLGIGSHVELMAICRDQDFAEPP
jgi:DNA-binding CsgD family transcriptional regulator